MLRPDQLLIADQIAEGAKVIDIGCGEGELLAHLTQEKNTTGHGIELEAGRVSIAVNRGLSVIQGDADNDLQYYPDNAFDYAILGQTLQVMRHSKHVLEEALRIADRVIVVIPNFGHIANRWYLLTRGRMPVTKALAYEWYETPNIHFCTVRDMLALAKETHCTIEKRLAIYKDGSIKPFNGTGLHRANLFCKYGMFVLKKKV